MHKVKKPKNNQPKKAPAKKSTAAKLPKKKMQWPAREAGKRVVLNIVNANVPLPKIFDPKQWQEIIASPQDPKAQLQTDLRGMVDLPDQGCDAIWNAGSFGYLQAHEVVAVLRELHRALVRGGVLMFNVTDMQRVGTVLAQGKIEHQLYNSAAGGIAAVDLIYGHRRAIQSGRDDLKINTGFTAGSIANKATSVGFGEVEVRRDGWMLHVVARKVTANPPDKPLIRIMEEDLNEMMRKRDNIDKKPEMMRVTPEDGLQLR